MTREEFIAFTHEPARGVTFPPVPRIVKNQLYRPVRDVGPDAKRGQLFQASHRHKPPETWWFTDYHKPGPKNQVWMSPEDVEPAVVMGRVYRSLADVGLHTKKGDVWRAQEEWRENDESFFVRLDGEYRVWLGAPDVEPVEVDPI